MKRVALIGSASSWHKAPFDDPGVTIWCHASVTDTARATEEPKATLEDLLFPKEDQDIRAGRLPRVDAFFEVHKREIWIKWAENMAEYEVPVYMHEHVEEVPKSTALPLKELLKRFRKLFSCTSCFMIAMAISEDYEEIGLYGIHAASDSEYAYEAPGIHYWLGLAEGMGIKVTVTEESSLLKQGFLYGYEDRPAKMDVLEYQLQVLDTELDKNEKQLGQYKINKSFMTGARAAFTAIAKNEAQRA